MKTKTVIRDVACENCMYGIRINSDDLYCKRLNKSCDVCRNYCVKTNWYAQMCFLNARLDAKLSNRRV